MIFEITINLCYFIVGIIAYICYNQCVYNTKKEDKIIFDFFEEKEKADDKWDVVYVLKNNLDSEEELRYSLRSLKNFKYNKVWFAGGQPKTLKPDCALPIEQKGSTITKKVRYTLEQVCRNENVSENFWLFNDDFYVMREGVQYPAYSDGDLAFLIVGYEDKNGVNQYSRTLRECLWFLKKHWYPTVNYDLHTPMLINKEKALEVLEKYPDLNNFRSVYGNYVKLETRFTIDVKYSDNSRAIDRSTMYLSSGDRSFKNGLIGEYIRQQFPNKSRFEL